MSDSVQVWCDVGGTFTDCFVVQPNQSPQFIKVLSSGIQKGTVSRWLDRNRFIDLGRQKEPDRFWQGATIRWLNADGSRFLEQSCVRFQGATGEIELSPLPEHWATHESRARYELVTGLEAPVLAARLLLGCPLSTELPALEVRLGTTRGTNALLTRTGEPCALVTTQGFADLLRIGYQERPDLFALAVKKRQPLHHCVVEIAERLAADGSILKPLDVEQAEQALRKLHQDGIRAIAVCLLHSYVNPVHELAISEIAHRIGFQTICVSHQVIPKIKAVMRGETTLVDAYLTPVVRDYLHRVAEQFGSRSETSLRVMASSGGLVAAPLYRGRDSVLSGPAGGAVAIEAIAKSQQIQRCIGLDMGGTSTDVCRMDGRLQLEQETIKAGVRMMIPTLAIHTVAAGGGSICWFDGVQLRVGPQSAGSDPGPACYGRGGPLTITDLNLLSGRIDKNSFPFALDESAATVRLHEILAELNATLPENSKLEPGQLVDGFRRIANEHMASAVRSISIAQGADPRDHALIGFGGAAGQHICEIADLLGMTHVIDPPHAGLLSALGMGLSSIQRTFVHPIYQPVAALTPSELGQIQSTLISQARSAFVEEGIPQPQIQSCFEAEVRYVATEGAIVLPLDDLLVAHEDLATAIQRRFAEAHRLRFGYVRDKELEWVAIRATFSVPSVNRIEAIYAQVESSDAANPTSQLPTLKREQLQPGQTIHGPRLIANQGSTTFIPAHWNGQLSADGILNLVRDKVSASASEFQTQPESTSVDPVLREVLAQRIAAIADQMGLVLEQTAMSVNVKDRRDFSCAVFSSRGDLIANAPHVPVHLGAMSQTIKQLLLEFPAMNPGDCFVTNDPFRGGSHLPDITVVTPVFVDASAVRFFVACRAHHAEIGGIAPGSMAPTSTRLGEEGVIIPPSYLVCAGANRMHEIEQRLSSGDHPSRAVQENLADLAAQQAANQCGVIAMQELAKQYGVDTLTDYLEHIQTASEAKTRAWIEKLERPTYEFQDCMDDGTPICVKLEPKRDDQNRPFLRIDFEGTGSISRGNLNANPAIVTAAVMYVIRCSIADSLPLNSGVLRCVELRIPTGILNPSCQGEQADWPAVAGGNVETSQRVVDCLLGALGLAAASQGTMNNFLFGNSRFGYYETIGGGTGATSHSNGEDAVHSHMTNTRLTDVEILEKRYPVRLVRFEIRQDSGGQGAMRGGNGLIRQVQALEPLDVSLVTSRRTGGPFGLHGGQSGQPGENWRIDLSGRREQLPSAAQLQLQPGESILIKTPGGGGYGTQAK